METMRKRLELTLTSLALLFAATTAWAAGQTPQIVSPTHAWNRTWDEVLIDLWAIGLVFGAVALYLLIRYRAKSPDAVGTAKPLTFGLALAWALIPSAIFMADDFLLAAKGWSLWNIQRRVPAGAMEVQVTGSQWQFEYDYGNGVTDSELIVPVGKPVVLRMKSNDVIHSFGLNEYRVKEDMMPGRVTYLWFYPDKPLETKVVCVEFCGNSHAEMTNNVRAIPQAEYEAWLAKKSEKKKAELDGRAAAGAATVTAR
jgi:cytochrome c oxidase subunit II